MSNDLEKDSPDLYPGEIALTLENFASYLMQGPTAELRDIDALIVVINEACRTLPKNKDAANLMTRLGQYIVCDQESWENLKVAAALHGKWDPRSTAGIAKCPLMKNLKTKILP